MSFSESQHGPLVHNTRIANALLDVLGGAGDVAGRARVMRAIGAEGSRLRNSETWLPGESMTALLRAIPIDRLLARRIGQSLVRPDGVGLALCYSGLATPEKAFRRSHHLLARESEVARYEPRSIADERGDIRFHPPAVGNAARLPDAEGQLVCAMREGMLESVPMLFGLVPATVRETACAYKGDPHCTFELRWSRSPRTGLLGGAAAGIVLAAGVAFGLIYVGLSPWLAGAAALLLPLLCAFAGRSFDLVRQLEAVAGSRRGQLALLEQLDDSLAEKLDQLAKVGGTEPGPAPTGELQGLVPVHRSGGDEDGGGDSTHAAEAAVGIHSAVIELRRDLGELYEAVRDGQTAEDTGARSLFRSCAAHGRRIEELSAELERRTGGFEGPDTEVSEMAPIVDRALAGLRPELPTTVTIDIHLTSEVSPVYCDPVQIEFVVEQLVRNAADAIDEKGIIRIGIGESPSGVELTVEDDGDGIEHHTVDEVFDPFFDETVAGQNASFGLPVCYRIVEEHGGELHVQSTEGQGTRVSVVLPVAPLGA